MDDIHSRKYIDEKCVDYFKCFLYSLTYGNIAHSQMTIPNMTSCYNDENDFVGDDYNDYLTKYPDSGYACNTIIFRKWEEYDRS